MPISEITRFYHHPIYIKSFSGLFWGRGYSPKHFPSFLGIPPHFHLQTAPNRFQPVVSDTKKKPPGSSEVGASRPSKPRCIYLLENVVVARRELRLQARQTPQVEGTLAQQQEMPGYEGWKVVTCRKKQVFGCVFFLLRICFLVWYQTETKNNKVGYVHPVAPGESRSLLIEISISNTGRWGMRHLLGRLYGKLLHFKLSQQNHRPQLVVFLHPSEKYARQNGNLNPRYQWLFLVPLKGGIGSIFRPPEGKDKKWYISGIYCQLGDYMPPTTF